jgi:hypothetical protein
MCCVLCPLDELIRSFPAYATDPRSVRPLSQSVIVLARHNDPIARNFASQKNRIPPKAAATRGPNCARFMTGAPAVDTVTMDIDVDAGSNDLEVVTVALLGAATIGGPVLAAEDEAETGEVVAPTPKMV